MRGSYKTDSISSKFINASYNEQKLVTLIIKNMSRWSDTSG